MLTEGRIRANNALTLTWHAGASTLGFEPFRQWCLSTLRTRLRFDGAIWGVLDDPVTTASPRLQSAYLHRLPEAALLDFERLRAGDLAHRPPPGGVVNVCITDPAWDGPELAVLRDQSRLHGMTNSLLARHALPDSPGEQVILLTRKAVAHRFSAVEALQFEWLAPHMMQAYATCRKLFVESAHAGDRRAIGFAAAMVDRAGVIHDHQARFLPMLRREWSDWPGKKLPEPMMEMVARRAGTRWRYVGMRVTADFEPVDDLFLIAARPRHLTDALTPRESEVAQRYAAGDNFREIAQALALAPATVRSHLRNVFGKLQVRNKTQLAAAMQG